MKKQILLLSAFGLISFSANAGKKTGAPYGGRPAQTSPYTGGTQTSGQDKSASYGGKKTKSSKKMKRRKAGHKVTHHNKNEEGHRNKEKRRK